MRNYFIIPKSQVTQKMLNLSTSMALTELRTCNCTSHVIVEASLPIDPVFLDYPGYDQERLLALFSNNQSEWGEQPQQMLAKVSSRIKSLGRRLIS